MISIYIMCFIMIIVIFANRLTVRRFVLSDVTKRYIWQNM